MAVVPGGIYGQPSGKAGGIVWGRARTRAGKVPTARAHVIPTDDPTASQLLQRSKFQTAALIMSNLGAATWQAAWNRTYGELPGWQAMQSWLLNGLIYSVSSYILPDSMPSKSLGPCLMPSDYAVVAGGASGEIDITWDTAIVGDHAATDDDLYAITLYKDQPTSTTEMEISAWATTRSAGALDLTGLIPGEEYSVYAWFRHEEPDGSFTYSPVGQGYATATA